MIPPGIGISRMQCNQCKYQHTNVVKTRHLESKNLTTRRRECPKCGKRFTTQEDIKIRNIPSNYQTPS